MKENCCYINIKPIVTELLVRSILHVLATYIHSCVSVLVFCLHVFLKKLYQCSTTSTLLTDTGSLEGDLLKRLVTISTKSIFLSFCNRTVCGNIASYWCNQMITSGMNGGTMYTDFQHFVC